MVSNHASVTMPGVKQSTWYVMGNGCGYWGGRRVQAVPRCGARTDALLWHGQRMAVGDPVSNCTGRTSG